MATYKVLGQVVTPAGGTTETALYTVPAGTSTVVSSIIVCNRAASAATYRIFVVPTSGTANPTTANPEYSIVYGATVPASDTVVIPAGITLAAGNQIRVYASTTTVAFSAFGSEV